MAVMEMFMMQLGHKPFAIEENCLTGSFLALIQVLPYLWHFPVKDQQ